MTFSPAPFTPTPYTPPDFTLPHLAAAPDVTLVPAPKDFVAPEGYHAMSIYPEYLKIAGQWTLARDSRMDCVAVVEGGNVFVREFRHIRAGDLIACGRTENGEEGILVYTDGFRGLATSEDGAPHPGGHDNFAFRLGRSRETAFSRDYDELYELLRHDRDHGKIVWVLGPACVFDHDSRAAMESLINNGYCDALFAGNALKNVVGWLSSVLTVFSLGALVYAYYMLRARMALSYTGGQVQSYVLDDVIERLRKSSFSGKGMLLDIGCGNGALTIKAAKKWPQLRVVGIDSWGKMWGYSQSQCEENAKLENVAAHVSFRAGDAAKLSFVDETFDGAVSNFVFHEVRSQPDKLALFQEMLRVLKPGAAFVIQDTYFDKRVYGDINAFVEQLRPRVKEIHFEDTRKPDYAPRFLNTPLVLGQMGVIWGRK